VGVRRGGRAYSAARMLAPSGWVDGRDGDGERESEWERERDLGDWKEWI
jgi:hypothetical protein